MGWAYASADLAKTITVKMTGQKYYSADGITILPYSAIDSFSNAISHPADVVFSGVLILED
jgi:hypothetical protein